MKKISLLALASLMVGLGSMSQAVHTIKNTSDHAIFGWIVYRGEVKWLKSCRTDEGVIQPGKTLTSDPGWCSFKFLQVQDRDKIIKLLVGSDGPGKLTLDSAPTIELKDGRRVALVVGMDTEWEYDGVNLKPVKGVWIVDSRGNILEKN